MKTCEYVDLFLLSRVTRNCTSRTLKWYRIILDKFAKKYQELPQKAEELDYFISSSPGKDERRLGYFRALKAFYRFLYKRYDIPNLILKIDAPRRKRKLPKSLTLENFIRLMHYNHPPNTQAYLEFISDTGCRVGELHNLKPEDIEHNDNGYIALLDGKSGEHFVPISDKTYQDILPHIPIRYNVDWVTRRISQAFKDAGVKGTAHNLRHTYATLWNGSEFALQEILGHSSFEILSNYRKLNTAKIAEQHHRFTLTNLLDFYDRGPAKHC